jgi:hypothetical protein
MPALFLIAAFHSWIARRDVGVARKLLSAPGLLLAVYCVIPGICLEIGHYATKRYWNRPIYSPTAVDRIYLLLVIFEFKCFILVPVAAIASILLLLVIRGRTLSYGAISVSLAWASLWLFGV